MKQAKPIVSYTVGFLFSPTAEQPTQVALVKKNRPTWQRGLLNGIGGHIEGSETPLECMVREFKEEAGAVVKEWDLFATLHFDNNTTRAEVHFFRSFTQASIRSASDEKIEWYRIEDVLAGKYPCVAHLSYLLPLALGTDQTSQQAVNHIEENEPHN